MVLGIPPYEPMAMTTPFTARDNISYLEKVNGIRAKLNELIQNTNITYTDLHEFVTKSFADLGIQWNGEFDSLRTEVIDQVNTPGTPAYNAIVAAAGNVYDPATADLLADVASATHAAYASTLAALLNDSTSAARSALADILPSFNIVDYGASTSAVDNRAAIQATINTAAAAGGGVVFVPVGTFNVVTVGDGTNGRTFSLASNVSIVGEDRKRSRIRVHESSPSDWGYFFAYPSTGAADNVTIRNITIDGGTKTNVTPATTDTTWQHCRSLITIYGKNATIRDCDLIFTGIWCLKHAGDNLRFQNNDVTANLADYTRGWFDVSAVWFFSQNAVVSGNTFNTYEPTVNNFPVQTAIEFQGHRNTVKDNKTSAGSRFRNGMIFTASTYYDGLLNFYPASDKGASDNIIENNAMTVIRYGVEIWGMVIPSPVPLVGNRILNNSFTILNSLSSASSCAGINIYTGTAGASGHDGVQTSGITDLLVSGNRVRFDTRRVSTDIVTADCGFRFNAVTPLRDIQFTGNVVTNCGGYGIALNEYSTSAEFIDGVDIINGNMFVDVREPVRVSRNVINWRVENNIFKQTQTWSNFADNMVECVNSRAGDFPANINGIIRRNVVRTLPTHKPLLPTQDSSLAQSYFPASRGFIVDVMEPRIQAGTNAVISMSGPNVVRRASDGVLVKAQYSGATLGTLTGVTIASVIDSNYMTVNDATNIAPGQSLSLPFNAPFSSGSCYVLAVVGNMVKVGSNQLAIAAGHTADEAVGKALTYYGAVVNA